MEYVCEVWRGEGVKCVVDQCVCVCVCVRWGDQKCDGGIERYI